ncbi:hypothetical protein [Streptomyces yaizuensis]|uniref:Uncharacterized protein n=1 Tax=Streptomyces yaizuensis TaxID=2989713 RepID=A0ABQ5P6A8_9ACTN|nr:hypothetical protein [Streptomyces sp. YSPA8]GLF98133.1 hypothetical protein SYYSPA8_27570 [Streptomyces sp. YSPA8]
MSTAPSSWPPGPGDASALEAAYREVLGWPVTHRPARVRFEEALEPGDAGDVHLGVFCDVFDAVVVPSVVAGLLTRTAPDGTPAPAMALDAEWTALLVRPGTGHRMVQCGGAVLTGADQWLALPPAGGRRWLVPPWHPDRPEPLPLYDPSPSTRSAPGTRPPAGAPLPRAAGGYRGRPP